MGADLSKGEDQKLVVICVDGCKCACDNSPEIEKRPVTVRCPVTVTPRCSQLLDQVQDTRTLRKLDSNQLPPILTLKASFVVLHKRLIFVNVGWSTSL